jgi:hypothetical protein
MDYPFSSLAEECRGDGNRRHGVGVGDIGAYTTPRLQLTESGECWRPT